jgi:hypothetical protein
MAHANAQTIVGERNEAGLKSVRHGCQRRTSRDDKLELSQPLGPISQLLDVSALGPRHWPDVTSFPPLACFESMIWSR